MLRPYFLDHEEGVVRGRVGGQSLEKGWRSLVGRGHLESVHRGLCLFWTHLSISARAAVLVWRTGSGSASVSALVGEERMWGLRLGSWSLTPSSASHGFRNLGRFLDH